MDQWGEAINEKGYRRMLRYMADGGTTVFVGGPHATEFVNMDRAERRWLWELSVDELGDNAGVNAIPFGPASTTEMITMFQMAKDMGFAGAQLYPGAQEGRGGDGLYIREAERYYRDVLEAIDMPMYLCGYHGGEIIDGPNKQVPLELLVELVDEYPHIVGVTVAAHPNDSVMREFVDGMNGKRPVRLSGALDWYHQMELGVYGFHSIQQSIAPTLCSTMMGSFLDGDREKAKQLSEVLKQLNAIVHTPEYHYPRTLKPILNHLGFDMGIIRRPYMPPPPEQQEEMIRRVAELDLGQYEDLP
jgi:dihydrodipicolinate synthase/N-acetylneuraminate lyase